jgi:hypothetical protein
MVASTANDGAAAWSCRWSPGFAGLCQFFLNSSQHVSAVRVQFSGTAEIGKYLFRPLEPGASVAAPPLAA